MKGRLLKFFTAICVMGTGISSGVALANPLQRLVEYQVLHYRQFGTFSISSSQMQRYTGINSHLIAPNANQNRVIVQLVPRSSSGYVYAVGVFTNPEQRSELLAVACQAKTPGRNLIPNPGLGQNSRGVFAGCGTSTTTLFSSRF